jgi:hypothetical protein
VRWGIKRDHYRVDPGLYALGTPDERSDVLVTANYKLTFDVLRKNLSGLNLWLLVLDTKGINVWCAAGKGTFGTEELVRRIRLTKLENVVIHRRLILPQLGATGIAAHLVKKNSGFTVIFGPVRASDIKLFLEAGYKAAKEMRLVKFGWYDRLKLIPNDFIYNLKYLIPLLVILPLISGFSANGFSVSRVSDNIEQLVSVILIGYASGIIATPVLLPFIPFQSFYLKGLITGAAFAVVLLINNSLGNNSFTISAGFFFIAGFSSFLAMLFTGASTFTSLAGVKKEMKLAVPVQIVCAIAASIFGALGIFVR